jgi:AcrR family transcriptional regulator
MTSSAITEEGRRARHKRDTRGRLVAAARKLFVSRGYDQTSMEEIARRAGVSRRTCFRYFPNKEDLAFPYREARLARFDELVREAEPGEAPYAAVRRACLVMAGELMAEREAVVAQERLIRANATLRARDRENDRCWEELITGALQRERQGDGQLARILAGGVIGMVRAAQDLWIDSGGRLNLVQLAHEVFALLDHGAPTLLAHRREADRARSRPSRNRPFPVLRPFTHTHHPRGD